MIFSISVFATFLDMVRQDFTLIHCSQNYFS